MFIVFPEAVVMRLLQCQHFEETVEMRDVSSNRIIGMGAEGPDVESPAGTSNMTIVTATSGALLVEIDVQKAQELDYQYVLMAMVFFFCEGVLISRSISLRYRLSSGADKIQILTQRLKSKLERGVFHSNELQVSLAFVIVASKICLSASPLFYPLEPDLI
jgi:hypothetical protein